MIICTYINIIVISQNMKNANINLGLGLIIVTTIVLGVIFIRNSDEHTTPKKSSVGITDKTIKNTPQDTVNNINIDKITKGDKDKVKKVKELESATETESAKNNNKQTSDKKNKAGIYTKYSASAVANSGAEHIILNFSADWCPSCQALKKDIKSNLKNIPSSVAIYEVDYDTEMKLRTKYKVTTQHTSVEIKSDGTLVKKWSGSPTLQDILRRIEA